MPEVPEKTPGVAEGTSLEALPGILGRQTLSTRTLGILLAEDIRTIEHLADVHPANLVRLPGVSSRTYREIVHTRLLWRMHTRTPKEPVLLETTDPDPDPDLDPVPDHEESP